jgi:hypothetical protein
MMWLHPADVVIHGVTGVPQLDRWLFFGGFIAAALGFGWGAFTLKKVVLTDNGIRVSNYLKNIVIPLSMIESIDQDGGINSALVVIRLRADLGMGRAIRFFPIIESGSIFSENSIVGELRQRAGVHSHSHDAA